MAVIEERKTKDGDITYRVKIRLKGHKPQEATFKRKTDAKNWATSTCIFRCKWIINSE